MWMQGRVYAGATTIILELLVAIFAIVRELVIIVITNQNKLEIYQHSLK